MRSYMSWRIKRLDIINSWLFENLQEQSIVILTDHEYLISIHRS